MFRITYYIKKLIMATSNIRTVPNPGHLTPGANKNAAPLYRWGGSYVNIIKQIFYEKKNDLIYCTDCIIFYQSTTFFHDVDPNRYSFPSMYSIIFFSFSLVLGRVYILFHCTCSLVFCWTFKLFLFFFHGQVIQIIKY